jgi:hypothetical protein
MIGSNSVFSGFTVSIDCLSDFLGTVTEDGTGTFSTLAFRLCTAFGFVECDESVTGGASSTFSISDNPDQLVVHDSIVITVDCSGVFHCTLSTPANLVLTWDDGGDPTTLDGTLETLTSTTGTTACGDDVMRWNVTYPLTVAGNTHPTVTF